MDVQQLFKRDHERMTTLFERLAETSDQATKTRERLVEQLTNEIEAHKAVVEQRLYPLLRKHKETRDLKPSARELNQLDRKLSEFQKMQVADPDFLRTARELKKTVEQHLREEERHILPALKKALEPGELEALAQELAEGKREELQEARQRNQPDAEEPSTRGHLHEVPKEAARTAQEILREFGNAGESGAQTVLDQQQRLSETVNQAAGAAQDNVTEFASHQMRRVASASQEAVAGVQEIQDALMDGFTGALQVHAEVARGFLSCGSAEDLSRLQRRLVEQWSRLCADTGTRLLQGAQRASWGVWLPRQGSGRSRSGHERIQ
jgi:hemerythrin-like domain-containing protein